mgnify:CR=1 FL=1
MLGIQDQTQDNLPSLIAQPQGPVSVGGILSIKSTRQLLDEEIQEAQKNQDAPVLRGMAGHIKQCWSAARIAKETTVEERMRRNVRARRNEYDPELLATIRAQGGSEIFMGITSTKCRAAASWLRDVLMGSDSDKPWTISPTPIPDLSPDILEGLVVQSQQLIAEFMQENGGQNPDDSQVKKMMAELKSESLAEIRAQAQVSADMMADTIEDQLVEGGWMGAMSDFIDDLTTFPAAILKGPVIRRKPKLQWVQGPQGWGVQVQDYFCKEIERVDPFDIYPAPSSSKIEDGYLIERHRMSRGDLEQLIGVEGYDDKSIRAVLSEHGKNGLHNWILNDTAQALAEGKNTIAITGFPDPEIDALQFWGPVSGESLLEWGMTEDEIPDPTKEYHAEAWLIGEWVIKATLNADPMNRKPYYKASWEQIPGAFWGNSVADLVRDSAMMCNSAARALANNMGIASGPQVGVNVSRLADGEDVTQMVPWRIWQFKSDQYGAADAPLSFFQPNSQAAELMGVYEKYSTLADEQSGVPKYISGDSAPGGAGRTASGLSMMLQSAGKSIKQVISSIDVNVIEPLLQRWYTWNMLYSEDETLKGDVQINARGVLALVNHETAVVRRNEFLQLALTSPIVQKVVGLEGIADLLREAAKGLDMDSARLVPPIEVLQKRWKDEADAQAQMAQVEQGIPPGQQQPASPGSTEMNQQTLQNGAPITDNFSTQPQG